MSKPYSTPTPTDPTSTLDGPAPGAPLPIRTGSRFQKGDTVGRFTVLDHLGTGGMGQVYAAYDPRLDRKVALKILRPFRASASRESRARLLREARALARLNDPHVLTLFEVGTFGDQIFLATEFVPGSDLGHWLQERQRSVDEIVAIFHQAGRGLVAAHDAGLVHRDFKWSNVMVRPDGRAVVLDFGLARHDEPDRFAVDGDQPAGGLDGGGQVDLTRVGVRLGTPRFMAPEQWAGERASAAADQFSFCVALYEALYDEPPFSPSEDPRQPPSWALKPPPAVAGKPKRSVPLPVRQVLRRGLAIEPTARFASMRALIDQLQIGGSRRRRRALAGSMLAAGLVLAVWQPWSRAPRPCATAGQQLDEVWNADRRTRLIEALESTGRRFARVTARSVTEHLDGYTSSWIDLYRDTCESTHLRGEQSTDLLDRRMACLKQRRRQLDAIVRVVTDEPESVIDDAVGAVERLPGLDACTDTTTLLSVPAPPPDPDRRRAIDESRDRLAQIQAWVAAGHYERAIAATEGLHAAAIEYGYWPLVAEVELTRGKLQSLTGQGDAAVQTLESALQAAQAASHHRPAAEAFIYLVRVAGYQLADFDRAERFGNLATTLVETLEPAPRLKAALADHLGVVALQQGQYSRAADLHSRALDIRRAAGSDDGPAAAANRIRLGNVLFEQGHLEAAEDHFQNALAIQETVLGAEHPTVAATLDRLGAVAHRKGDLDVARRAFERALDLLTATFGQDHPRLSRTLGHLANVLSSAGETDAALTLYDRVLAIDVREHGDSHPWVGITWINIAEVKTQIGDLDGAVEALDRALPIVEAAYGDEHPLVAQILNRRGSVLTDLGRYAAAERFHRRALGLQRRSFEPDHPLLGHTLTALGRSLLEQGRLAASASHLETALELWRDSTTAPVHIAWTQWLLGRAVAETEPERAVDLVRNAETVLRQDSGDHAETLADIAAWLASRRR